MSIPPLHTRRPHLLGLCLLLGLLARSGAIRAQGTVETVPTFTSLGISWHPDTPPDGRRCTVRFRENPGTGPTGAWRQGLDLWYDDRTGDNTTGFVGPSWRRQEYRGSLVHLLPGTRYEVELSLAGGPVVTVFDTTWSEDFPLDGNVVVLDGPAAIHDGGTPGAYVLVTAGQPGQPITAPNAPLHYPLIIDAPYVVVRGLTLRGGQHGIYVTRNAHHVVIEECDIADWGTGTPHSDITGWGDECAGIYVFDGWASPTDTPEDHVIRQIVIQRNRIHDPHYDSNNWCEYNQDNTADPCHPLGPLGIEFVNPWGNNVIRYNEIWSDNGHDFTDGIGGHDNYSYFGCPGRDSDIYGNWIADVWDDAIETEGGNANVRVWGNFLDRFYVGIACAATATGPLYVWRNVVNRSDRYDEGTLTAIAGEDACSCMEHGWDPPRPMVNAGRFVKTTAKGLPAGGTTYYWGGGRVYLLHNTVLQQANDPMDDHWFWPPWPYEQVNQGVAFGLNACRLSNFYLRNNLLQVVDKQWYSLGFPDSATMADLGLAPSDLDYDLLNGVMVINTADCAGATIPDTNTVHEPHGFYSRSDQRYVPVWGVLIIPARGEAGSFQLAAGAAGRDDAAPLPNFNDGPWTIGAGPDRGAHEAGAPPMTFGVNAGMTTTSTGGLAGVEPPLAWTVAPNPASSVVRVTVAAPDGGAGKNGATIASLTVYDLHGRRVARRTCRLGGATPQVLTWDGRDQTGHRVGEGVYLLCLRVGKREVSDKVLLIR